MVAIPADSLVLAVVVLFAFISVFGVVTVGLSVRWARIDRRRAAVRDRVRAALLSALFSSDVEWESWLETLSSAERRELKGVIDTYLRRLRGAERERLCELARTMEIDEEARRSLDRRWNRFRGLTWLALLGESVEPDRLRACCSGSVRVRTGAARVLFEARHPQAEAVGTDLLLGDGQRPLTVFGLDTLYRLNQTGEAPVLAMAVAESHQWDDTVLVQVLTVLRFCQPDASGRRFAWVVPLLDHDSPQVRQAAVGVLERHGWRSSVRRRISVEGLLTDPNLQVRTDTYLALASWGDTESLSWIYRGLFMAETDQELLAGVRALLIHPLDGPPPEAANFRPYVEWVDAELANTGGHVWGGVAWA